MDRQRSELWVGLLVLAALAIFLYGSVRIGGCAPIGTQARRVVARFDDAAGVALRSEVRMAGVRIGEVERVELEESRARLVLRIEDPDAAIPVDSTVRLRSQGLLGDRVVELAPGSSTQLLSDGDTLTQTVEAPNLDRLLERLAAVSDDVQAVSQSLRLVLGGPEGEASLGEIVENVRLVSGEMRGFLEKNEARLAATVDNLHQFSSDLARLTTEHGGTVEDLLGRMRAAATRMEETLDRVAAASRRVEEGQGTLGRLIQDEGLYEEAEAALGELRAALAEVRRAAEDAQEQLPVTVLGSVVGTLF